MNDKPDITTVFGRTLGVCSISALLILWTSTLVFGVGWLLGQDWTFAGVIITNLFVLGVIGFVGVCFWR